MGLFSAKAPVYAMLSEDFFVGTAVGYVNRTGAIDIQSVVNDSIRCVGEFRYTGAKTGTGSLNCNDGTSAELRFNSLSSISGYGYGNSTRGPASFTYGLTPEQAEKYLMLPENTRLQKNEDESVGLVTT
jgi:hypothetical protein